MRSTHFVDKDELELPPLIDEDDTLGMDVRGFLALAVVFFIIYALAPRPILYAAVGQWFSELLVMVMSWAN
jgi:hypothetical protein